MDERTRALWMTIRRALLMVVKGLEEAPVDGQAPLRMTVRRALLMIVKGVEVYVGLDEDKHKGSGG